jgi:hypothetical protein
MFMGTNYDWMKFYTAAVEETNPEFLPSSIEAARVAIALRVFTPPPIDESERRAIVAALNAMTALKQKMCAARKFSSAPNDANPDPPAP